MPKIGEPLTKMLRVNTPLEDYREEYGLWVKREDLACYKPGPQFSKTRGVFAHIKTRTEKVIGALDTRHSQAGHAVARACQILGKRCINYYPEFKHEPGHRAPQEAAKSLGAELVGLPAGRSAILYHAAKKHCLAEGGYMMPNALKLVESVFETAKEVNYLPPGFRPDNVLIPISSGTIAAGVIRGFNAVGHHPKYLIHLGYGRSLSEVARYLEEQSGVDANIVLIDENYAYKDVAMPGPTPPWPCNEHYDLKAFRWWLHFRIAYPGETLFWNIG